jgi:hypothetical protein
MTKLLLPLSLGALLAVALSFTPEISLASVAPAGPAREIQPVYTTPDGFLLGPVVPGAYATLLRSKNGLTMNVHTSVMSGPGAYTVWWVLFNHPDSCMFYLCTFDQPDLVVNATGHVVSSGGTANFAARLSPGGPYSGEIVYEGPEPTLTNPEGALITLVVRYHGRTIPSMLPLQLTTFEGGCPGGGAPCVDEQLVVFPGECSGACSVPF